MRTVHKFVLNHDNTETIVRMPLHAKVLHGGYQENISCLCMWFELETDHPLMDRKFSFIGTGRVVPDGARFINTCILQRGGLALHLYEIL